MNVVIEPPTPEAAAVKDSGAQVRAFEHIERASGLSRQPAWLFPIRKAGIARFADLGFPTLRHEDWRFTNIAPLVELPFRPVFDAAVEGVSAGALQRLPFAQLPGPRLVFVDGHFAPHLSRAGAEPTGATLLSLGRALQSNAPGLQAHLSRSARMRNSAFVALNEAYFSDGAFLYVPQGEVMAEPIQLLFVSTGAEAGRASHPRNLLVAEARSQVTVIEHFVSLADAPAVTNVVTEWVVGEGAAVEHLRFQDESERAFHIGALDVTIGGGATFRGNSFALGARLSRQEIHVTLAGPRSAALLHGLYITTGERLADHHMVVDHAQPHCDSHEHFNGVLSGRSKGVFHGRILVRKGAQKTDAKQTNKNVLLSDEATVDTKPQLEIYADDVKCTHGATVGQLSPESLFYLRARGIPIETARRMLIHAFAGEIIDRVQYQGVREELDRLVWERLEREERVHVG